MYHGKRPAARLKAARHALILAAEANEFEEFAAGVADAERIQAVARYRPISGRAPIGDTARNFRDCRNRRLRRC